MAQQAERTLDVQYFVVENDDTGKLIQEALLQAADRGVRVRVLLDDEGSRGRTAKLTPLAAHQSGVVSGPRRVSPRRGASG